MSAYDKGGTSRAQQLALLTKIMSEERAKGNYVIAGGDWNHAILGSLTALSICSAGTRLGSRTQRF